ncbi:DUF4870 domain-containing protein [Microbacteriaceae bacterium 4G12]
MSEITEFDQKDIEKNKAVAGLSYFLFFLPFLVAADSKYARFHANQSLILLIISVAGGFILGMIPVIGWIVYPFFCIAVFILYIIGLINAFNGKAKRLPLVGEFDIFK